MTKREKVLKGLESHYMGQCFNCPYEDDVISTATCKRNLAHEAIEVLNEQPQWISVKKKLPEQAGYRCIVSAEYGDRKRAYFIAFTGYGESEWYTYDVLFMEKERESDNRVHHNYHITHWMPLPEPLKEGN